MNNIFRMLALLCPLALVAVPGSAQQTTPPPDTNHHGVYSVPDYKILIPGRAVEFKSYRAIILANPAYSDDEKASKIAAKFMTIHQAVRAERIAAYKSVNEKVSVANSCTKAGGSSKTCEQTCAGASLPVMYVEDGSARGAWAGDTNPDAAIIGHGNDRFGAEIVTADKSQVCAIKLKQSGNGRKVSYSEAIFRIRPERIEAMVNEEMAPLLYGITNTAV